MNVGNPEEPILNVLSFCSGYAGIERGLDLAGVRHRVLAYVEVESFAIANLVAKMEAGELGAAPIYTDLKTFPSHLFRGAVDVITGGYPCQPFSAAGQRKGEDDPRHLWPFIYHHISRINPSRVFFENVEGHISLGLREVLASLEGRGYETAWGIFSAVEVGAPHQRKRVYIMADADTHCRGGSTEQEQQQQRTEELAGDSQGAVEPPVADATGQRVQGLRASGQQESRPHAGQGVPVRESEIYRPAPWDVEPCVGRLVDGHPSRVDSIRLLGNGVVPQTAALSWSTLDHELNNRKEKAEHETNSMVV